MALEDMKSVYGPTTKKNEIGTGINVDKLGFEGDNNRGVGFVASTLGPTPPLGKPQEKFGGEGERSLKKFPGERTLELK
tara:strand:+ start:34 stop:270 length:237 start_codon:yes stop_codon:yes gene_type:complete